MATTKYDRIYEDLKSKIEGGMYPFGELLPSEYTLIEEYACARNTVRRALSQLAAEGHVQSMHGKGVRVIWQPQVPSQYALGRIESFKEASEKNGQATRTQVVAFEERTIGEEQAVRTGFAVGTKVYYIQRVRYFDGKALIIDHNWFHAGIVKGLTPQISAGSIYEYIEQVLGEDIVTTKRVVTVERANALDEKYLRMGSCNCVAVVTGSTYNADGVMFEFTQSRHQPDHFVFYDQAHRVKR